MSYENLVRKSLSYQLPVHILWIASVSAFQCRLASQNRTEKVALIAGVLFKQNIRNQVLKKNVWPWGDLKYLRRIVLSITTALNFISIALCKRKFHTEGCKSSKRNEQSHDCVYNWSKEQFGSRYLRWLGISSYHLWIKNKFLERASAAKVNS